MQPDSLATSFTSMKLSMLIGTMLQHSRSFTDIHIESNKAVMLRTSAGEWMQALDNNDRPITVPHLSIVAFVAGIYTGREEARPPQTAPEPWEQEFRETGSLHPAHVILVPADDGKTKRYRVRCSIQRQSMGDAIGLVVRALHNVPGSIEKLGLPSFLVNRMINASSGLVVVTGPTGSGKSTTCAAMLQTINKTRPNNILTIEDPIEFEFERDKCMINQRELLVDVPSFAKGVSDSLRFVPDVILVGEMRDESTMRAVLRAAESGHLVLTTMHAPTAVTAIRKMLALLDSPADAQALASCLVGVIAQGLVQTVSGREDGSTMANCLAYEILNCKDATVNSAIMNSSRGAPDQLGKVDELLRSGKIEGSIPMIKTLRELVTKKSVEPGKAASLTQNAEDRAEFLRLANETKKAT